MYFYILFILLFFEHQRYKSARSFKYFYKKHLFIYLQDFLNVLIYITNYNTFFFNEKTLPIHEKLILNHDKIVDEFQNALNNYTLLNPGVFDKNFEQDDNSYGYFFLNFFGDINTNIIPTLKQIVKETPGLMTCFVSVMNKKIDIPMHNGPNAGLLRYHYTLLSSNNKNDYLEVMNKKFYWNEKEGFLFDDTYTHCVKKKSSDLRVTIICDFERDSLIFPLSWLNKINTRYLKNIKNTKNMQYVCVPQKKEKLKIF